jgi:hypothetical protein
MRKLILLSLFFVGLSAFTAEPKIESENQTQEQVATFDVTPSASFVNLFEGSFYDSPEFVNVVESSPVNSEVFKTYNVKQCGTDSNGDHYCCYFDGCCRVVCRRE